MLPANFILQNIDGNGEQYISSDNSGFDKKGVMVKSGKITKIKMEFNRTSNPSNLQYLATSDVIIASWEYQELKSVTAAKEAYAKQRAEAQNRARSTFASVFPYPSEVKFPSVIYDTVHREGETFEMGTVKYKNGYGNKVESKYRLWYDDDGLVKGAEVDDILVL